MSWYRLYTLIHLFISCELYSYNFQCRLNSNVKRGLLENCSSSVTKLRPNDITSVIDYAND